MQTKDELIRSLTHMEGKPYPVYKSLKKGYQYQGYELWIDHVQGDPFAVPSKVRVRISIKTSGFPENTFSTHSRKVALCDFIARKFNQAISLFNRNKQGSGKSGMIEIDRPGQEVLDRSSVVMKDGFLEIRFLVGLPAYGRRIAGKVAAHMFTDIIPRIIDSSIYYRKLNEDKLYRHIETIEDADFIRAKLPVLGLVAFVADKSILPRASGVDSRPLHTNHVIPFESCQSLHVSLELPNYGTITGMGIPKGITLIVGGGYHGKSTLLNALEHGIYNHIPGDGREYVITSPDAVKIRAEDGRSIRNLDISPFIANLPFGQDTTEFSTANASGSTSQAANILESLEIGAKVLLLDEDTLATNFMIRDRKMKALIARDKEPIIPFIDHIRGLYEEMGISTILVMGGCGDYFDMADVVIGMIEYHPHDLTSQAHQIAKNDSAAREYKASPPHEILRIPLPDTLDASKGKYPVKIKSEGVSHLFYGVHQIQLWALEQLVHPSQLRAIGQAIHYARRYMDGRRSIKEICNMVLKDLQKKGLDCLSEQEPRGDFAEFRSYELAATLNRFRGLQIK